MLRTIYIQTFFFCRDTHRSRGFAQMLELGQSSKQAPVLFTVLRQICLGGQVGVPPSEQRARQVQRKGRLESPLQISDSAQGIVKSEVQDSPGFWGLYGTQTPAEEVTW